MIGPKKAEMLYSKKVNDAFQKIIPFIRHLKLQNGEILFVSNNPDYKKLVQKIGLISGQPTYTGKWVGGFLTNADPIQSFAGLAKSSQSDNVAHSNPKSLAWTYRSYPGKPQPKSLYNDIMTQQVSKGTHNVRNLRVFPSLVVILDLEDSWMAYHEATLLNIPVIGFTNTVHFPQSIAKNGLTYFFYYPPSGAGDWNKLSAKSKIPFLFPILKMICDHYK